MNTAGKAIDAIWSLLCMAVVCGLLGLFVFWVLIQDIDLAPETPSVPVTHTVTAGSIVYFENTAMAPDTAANVSFTGKLIQNGEVKYVLPSPDTVSREVEISGGETVVADKPRHPLYALFIPSYVRRGDYVYQVTAMFRLNPLKTKSVELPPLIIKVE